MAKPAILAVDDDAAVVAAVVRDLRQRYGPDYRVLRATSGLEALEVLADQLLKDRAVAAVVSDQRMPGMTGIELMQEVRQQSPDSKLLLLTAYADTDVAIRAINDIALDYYLMKPWDPPEERATRRGHRRPLGAGTHGGRGASAAARPDRVRPGQPFRTCSRTWVPVSSRPTATAATSWRASHSP
jgi:CheY-like chemotaxis protein